MKNKGISLVALIITILTMIILAAVVYKSWLLDRNKVTKAAIMINGEPKVITVESYSKVGYGGNTYRILDSDNNVYLTSNFTIWQEEKNNVN